MPGGVEHRSVTPLLKAFRNVLRGKQLTEGLRFADKLASRTQPPPNIPGGPYHKTSKIYYYARDARRLVQPPECIYSADKIGKGGLRPEPKQITPGKLCNPEN